MITSHLFRLLPWLAITVIIRVCATIVSNYDDYFPANFSSLFLQGREATFTGAYQVAFYAHILTMPILLLLGLVLLFWKITPTNKKLHQQLGKVQVCAWLLIGFPSSIYMACFAYTGWLAGSSFILLSVITTFFALQGVRFARQKQFAKHERWMTRFYLLITSAVFLRLLSGTLTLLDIQEPEVPYILAAWCSWLIPLGVFEIIHSYARRATKQP